MLLVRSDAMGGAISLNYLRRDFSSVMRASIRHRLDGVSREKRSRFATLAVNLLGLRRGW
jgi:hypothetical protein